MCLLGGRLYAAPPDHVDHRTSLSRTEEEHARTNTLSKRHGSVSYDRLTFNNIYGFIGDLEGLLLTH
jgi:hypothetical protein